MKKERTVKSYQRRTKSGKVITVRQHTAKYDAADKAAEASKRKGSGEELESLKKSKEMGAPEISKDDFKEWYNFDEWDTPKKDWPDVVKKVDSHLRKTLGKKGYDDYCAKIDENWSARGHSKAYKDFSIQETKALLNKEYKELVARNGGTINRGNKMGKRIQEIEKNLYDLENANKKPVKESKPVLFGKTMYEPDEEYYYRLAKVGDRVEVFESEDGKTNWEFARGWSDGMPNKDDVTQKLAKSAGYKISWSKDKDHVELVEDPKAKKKK